MIILSVILLLKNGMQLLKMNVFKKGSAMIKHLLSIVLLVSMLSFGAVSASFDALGNRLRTGASQAVQALPGQVKPLVPSLPNVNLPTTVQIPRSATGASQAVSQTARGAAGVATSQVNSAVQSLPTNVQSVSGAVARPGFMASQVKPVVQSLPNNLPNVPSVPGSVSGASQAVSQQAKALPGFMASQANSAAQSLPTNLPSVPGTVVRSGFMAPVSQPATNVAPTIATSSSPTAAAVSSGAPGSASVVVPVAQPVAVNTGIVPPALVPSAVAAPAVIVRPSETVFVTLASQSDPESTITIPFEDALVAREVGRSHIAEDRLYPVATAEQIEKMAALYNSFDIARLRKIFDPMITLRDNPVIELYRWLLPLKLQKALLIQWTGKEAKIVPGWREEARAPMVQSEAEIKGASEKSRAYRARMIENAVNALSNPTGRAALIADVISQQIAQAVSKSPEKAEQVKKNRDNLTIQQIAPIVKDYELNRLEQSGIDRKYYIGIIDPYAELVATMVLDILTAKPSV